MDPCMAMPSSKQHRVPRKSTAVPTCTSTVAVNSVAVALAFVLFACANTCNAFSLPSLPSRRHLGSSRYLSSSDSDGTAASTLVDASPPKQVLVLGGTGFVGSEVCKRLSSLGIPYKSTSTSGSGSTIQLDLTAPDAELKVADLVASTGSTAVISTVGSINTPDDEKINAASGKAALGARMGGATKFVFIGNDAKVRELSKLIPFLKDYAAGKEESESKIRDAFGPSGYCIVQPTFIFGGNDFGLNPPRVATSIGQLAEEVLGLYPIQAAADTLPGLLAVPLAPPVSRERVAAAAVNAALGLCEGRPTLEGAELIIAASKRLPIKAAVDMVFDEEEAMWEQRESLKRRLFALGPDGKEEAITVMEELEGLRPASMRPIEEPSLNGRWDFVFDVEPDLGTGVIRQLIESPSPLVQPVFDLKDVRMEISHSRTISIVVATKVLSRECELVLTTSLLPDDTDTEGTTVLERFEGVKLAEVDLFVPDSWKRSRPLEISYLDEDMLIARSNGGKPHFLLRDK